MSNDSNEKNTLIVQDNCGYCEKAQEILSAKILRGEIEVINANSIRGNELIQKHEIQSTPIMINQKDDLAQKCYLGKDGDKMFCDDGSEKELR